MNKQFALKVKLVIQGPFITSMGTDAKRGLDHIFALDAAGKPILNGSHVKGKLREAMEMLARLGLLKGFDNDTYFGEEGDKRGILHFGNFKLNSPSSTQDGFGTRVTIEPVTGTAKEKNLQVIEALFRPGESGNWTGEILIHASDKNKAGELAKQIELGFKWITAFGSIKGAGYGRLKEVSVKVDEVAFSTSSVSINSADSGIALALSFIDDLMIGDIKRGVNYQESKHIIPGSVIKGSFARHLNALCGVANLAKEIDKTNQRVAKEFPVLAEFFSDIRFTHAFPTHPGSNLRPVSIPFSTVYLEGVYYDVARTEGTELSETTHKSPTFQIDWKATQSLSDEFGWAACEVVNKIRTAINETTGTADENQLYTFQYIAASDQEWLSEIQFTPAQFPDAKVRKALVSEFEAALTAGWMFMGKRDAGFTFSARTGHWTPAKKQHPSGKIVETQCIITLQTDALLFDGKQIAKEHIKNVESVYSNYWHEVTNGACRMADFFARQKMAGGYLARKFQISKPYYPYILTEAGSVFILEIVNEEQAPEYIEKFQSKGLPLPSSIIQAMSEDRPIWQQCPFAPENGFGEVAINLNWHWSNIFSS